MAGAADVHAAGRNGCAGAGCEPMGLGQPRRRDPGRPPWPASSLDPASPSTTNLRRHEAEGRGLHRPTCQGPGCRPSAITTSPRSPGQRGPHAVAGHLVPAPVDMMKTPVISDRSSRSARQLRGPVGAMVNAVRRPRPAPLWSRRQRRRWSPPSIVVGCRRRFVRSVAAWARRPATRHGIDAACRDQGWKTAAARRCRDMDIDDAADDEQRRRPEQRRLRPPARVRLSKMGRGGVARTRPSWWLRPAISGRCRRIGTARSKLPTSGKDRLAKQAPRHRHRDPSTSRVDQAGRWGFRRCRRAPYTVHRRRPWFGRRGGYGGGHGRQHPGAQRAPTVGI